jgi:urease accessory protein
MADRPWLAWQLVDSAFPTGGFAHSWGLEAAWHHGAVPDADALKAFLRGTILQAGYASLPLMNAAFAAPSRLAELDALNDAFLTNAVANRASRVQGRTLVATSVRVFPGPALTSIDNAASALAAHVAPLAGALFRAMDLALETSQRILLYLAARGVLSAAVRLGIAGSYEAQRIQADTSRDLDTVLERCASLDEGDLAQPAPLIDLWQGSHDRLYSRLFQS